MQSKWALGKLGYNVLDDIGKGGYGQVKLATSKKHPDKVAIKIMEGDSMSPMLANVFLPRELDILRQVKHPNIVEVYDIHEMPNKTVFIVMEAAAMTLFQKVTEGGALPADQARTLFSQLVSAVSYLHQQHIAHRDLKSENVLLTADGQVKLTDFGLSCCTSGFPYLLSEFYGTLEHAAPELLMHERYDGKKSDVWSLGVVLYFMVIGRLPFKYDKQKGKATVLRSQRKGVQFPQEMPIEEPCKELITRMLCFNPRKRCSIAEVQQDPWLQSVPEQVIDRPAETADEEERKSSASSPDVTAVEAVEEELPATSCRCDSEQEAVGSKIGASRTHIGVEDVGEEESGCIGCCCSIFTAVKSAAKKYVAAPILKTTRIFRRNIRKILPINLKA